MPRHLAGISRKGGSQSSPALPPRSTALSRPQLQRAGARYTRFVGVMKVFLPVIAGALVVMVVVWPEFSDEPNKFQLGVAQISIEDAGDQKLINARYTGTDGSDNPYTVTADALVQDLDGGELVDLKNPKADVTINGGSWVALTAPKGQYSKTTEVLELMGGVNVFHDQGYEFQTERAIVDFHYGSAFGDTPVRGQGPFGELSSEGFLILDGGASVVFTGQARLVMFPDQEKAER